MLFDLIKYTWEVGVRVNLFKQAIRREIYLFMFMLGVLALLGQLHRGEDAALMEELMLSLMRGAVTPHHRRTPNPNLQGAEPARRSRSEPNNLFSGRSTASLYILPAFPFLTAGRCLRLVLELAPQLFWEQRCWRNRGLDFCNFHLIAMPATSFPRHHVPSRLINRRNHCGRWRTIGSSPLAHGS